MHNKKSSEKIRLSLELVSLQSLESRKLTAEIKNFQLAVSDAVVNAETYNNQ